MPEAAARNFDKLVAARGGSNQSHLGFFGRVPEDGIHSPPASKLFARHDWSDLSEYRPGCIPTKVRHSTKWTPNCQADRGCGRGNRADRFRRALGSRSDASAVIKQERPYSANLQRVASASDSAACPRATGIPAQKCQPPLIPGVPCKSVIPGFDGRSGAAGPPIHRPVANSFFSKNCKLLSLLLGSFRNTVQVLVRTQKDFTVAECGSCSKGFSVSRDGVNS